MSDFHRSARTQRHQALRYKTRGIALIEALVGILIFTIGLLGVVGLQAAMMRAQGSAKSRADAAVLASELTGLMWSDYDNVVTKGLIARYNSTPTTACTTQPCMNWVAKVQSELPQGGATIATDATTGTTTISITWTPPHEEQHTYVTSTTIR